MQNVKYLFKDAFVVIGKAGYGPADRPQDWVLPLWADANARFGEIAGVIRKSENGGPLVWGAMNDMDESNKRWDTNGKYMAGCEADVDAIAPAGWTKWVIPAQTYLVAACTAKTYGEVFGKITRDPDISITGTIHERYPQPGNPNLLELYVPVAEGMLLCQSCAMPMLKPEDFGTNADGGKNGDYCCYCYKEGSFGKDETMEQMIETCVPFALEAGAYKTAEEARTAMMSFFPTLKRWKKA